MADKYIVGTGLWSDVAGNGVGGGTPVAQSGPIQLGAGGGINIPFTADSKGVPISVIAEHISIESTGFGFDGYAVISKGV